MRVTLIDLWGREAMLHYVSQLANNLAQRPGVQVTVLLPKGADTSLFTASVNFDFLDVVMDASLGQLLTVPIKLAKLPRFFQTIRRTRPDILHLNNCHVWYLLALPWLIRHYPVISTLHDVEPHPGLDDTWRKRKEIETSARFSDYIFVHGEPLKQMLLAKFPFLSQAHILTIPLGEFSFFTNYPTTVVEEENVALFFGRIRAYKGLGYFLQAAEIVTTEIPGVRFVIAGEGDLNPYQKYIKNSCNIEIINRYTPNDQVAALFTQASIVVLPYTEASQSGVIPVAFAFKKPVITTHVGCLADVIQDGRTGLMVPPHDAGALATAIIRLLRDDDLRKTIGRNGYQKMVDELGWDKIIDLTLITYETALKDFIKKKGYGRNHMNDQDHQNLTVKKGEVSFRQKLASQQSRQGTTVFPELDNYDGMLGTMRQRVASTRTAMSRFSKEGIPLSPFIELGAERCQRSSVLVNEFGAEGFAVDISFDMLRVGAQVARDLGFTKLPKRICCDANNLPIRESALSFAFCYMTLHHFPDPEPITKELARVLRDRSVFYFDEEPVKGSVYRFSRIYQRHGHRMSSFEKALDRIGLLPLISQGGGVETDHGILENEFNLDTWQEALTPFQNIAVTVNKKLNLHVDNFRPSPSKALAGFLGGNIEVRCSLAKEAQVADPFPGLLEVLRCPTCSPKVQAPLHTDSHRSGLQCDECGCFYPEVDGVLFLFEKTLGRNLYPAYHQ